MSTSSYTSRSVTPVKLPAAAPRGRRPLRPEERARILRDLRHAAAPKPRPLRDRCRKICCCLGCFFFLALLRMIAAVVLEDISPGTRLCPRARSHTRT